MGQNPHLALLYSLLTQKAGEDTLFSLKWGGGVGFIENLWAWGLARWLRG